MVHIKEAYLAPIWKGGVGAQEEQEEDEGIMCRARGQYMWSRLTWEPDILRHSTFSRLQQRTLFCFSTFSNFFTQPNNSCSKIATVISKKRKKQCESSAIIIPCRSVPSSILTISGFMNCLFCLMSKSCVSFVCRIYVNKVE